MKSLKIFIILSFLSFSLYAQNTPAPKTTSKQKTEKKYIDLQELKAMKANGASEEEVNARYNQMIEVIDRDFHGVPVKNIQEPDLPIGKTATKLVKEIKPLSL